MAGMKNKVIITTSARLKKAAQNCQIARTSMPSGLFISI
jgi:hypothetical protein